MTPVQVVLSGGDITILVSVVTLVGIVVKIAISDEHRKTKLEADMAGIVERVDKAEKHLSAQDETLAELRAHVVEIRNSRPFRQTDMK